MMTAETAARRRRDLGDFVRARREELQPAAVGLPPGLRRRTPGLRREEAAHLAGVSATWFTWLEQGRDIALSAAALDRVARALRLSRAQRVYLFELAGRRDPATPGATAEEDAAEADSLRASLAALVEGVAGPAYVLDRCWRVLAHNAAFAALFPGCPGREDNFLRYIFLDPAPRALIPDWGNRTRRALAEFRLDSSAHLDDPAVDALISDLSARSADFAHAWMSHRVLAREGGNRSFHRPGQTAEQTPLTFNQMSFTLTGHPGIKLVMLIPAPPDPAPAP